jgi:hypothetical protein
MDIFTEYILGFAQVFLDDFAVFGRRKAHQQHVELRLKECRETRLSLNSANVHLQQQVDYYLATLLARTEL